MSAKKTSRVFDYVNALSSSKDASVAEDIDFEKHYVPFIVNRALSYHADTVLSANLMNERPWLTPRLQFLFLLNTTRARRRYSAWHKHIVSDDAKTVSEYYGCSLRHARGIVDLHSSDQLTVMRGRLNKGGSHA